MQLAAGEGQAPPPRGNLDHERWRRDRPIPAQARARVSGVDFPSKYALSPIPGVDAFVELWSLAGSIARRMRSIRRCGRR